jgi:hypothetical protein
MNCLRKRREKETGAPALAVIEEKEELRELTILLEGRYVDEDYLS